MFFPMAAIFANHQKPLYLQGQNYSQFGWNAQVKGDDLMAKVLLSSFTGVCSGPRQEDDQKLLVSAKNIFRAP